MLVHLGPVPSASVRSWVAYARTVLAQGLLEDLGAPLPDDAVHTIEGYLDEWDEAARNQDPLVWVGDVDAEHLEFLAHCFYRLSTTLADKVGERGYQKRPPEAEEFYQVLVRAIMDALELEDEDRAAFSEQLRADWPDYREG